MSHRFARVNAFKVVHEDRQVRKNGKVFHKNRVVRASTLRYTNTKHAEADGTPRKRKSKNALDDSEVSETPTRMNSLLGTDQKPSTPAAETAIPVPTPESSSIAPACSSVLGTVDTLSPTEKVRLQACELTIQAGWKTFVEVGQALARIRDEELYRAEFNDFKSYYQTKWEFQHSKVYSLIKAAQVYTSISTLTDVPMPDCESQLRPLFELTPPQVQLAWQCAVGKSGPRKVTGRCVKSAVKELQFLNKPPTERQPVKKSEQRRQVSSTVEELLILVARQAAFDLLTEKVETLHRQIQTLFAPAVRRSKKN